MLCPFLQFHFSPHFIHSLWQKVTSKEKSYALFAVGASSVGAVQLARPLFSLPLTSFAFCCCCCCCCSSSFSKNQSFRRLAQHAFPLLHWFLSFSSFHPSAFSPISSFFAFFDRAASSHCPFATADPLKSNLPSSPLPFQQIHSISPPPPFILVNFKSPFSKQNGLYQISRCQSSQSVRLLSRFAKRVNHPRFFVSKIQQKKLHYSASSAEI